MFRQIIISLPFSRTFKAHDLRARELSGIADPYAKIRLLPDRSNVWQTTIHRRTLNPGKKISHYLDIAQYYIITKHKFG